MNQAHPMMEPTETGRQLLPDLWFVSWLGMTPGQIDCHVFVLRGESGLLLVDCGTPWGYARIADNMASWGLAIADVRTVLLTHAHVDHVSNGYLFKRQGAEVLGHREILTSVECQWEATGALDAHGEAYRIDGWLTGGDCLSRCGFDIQVIATPGHTRGCLSYLIEVNGERCLFSGDLIMSNGLPGYRGDPGYSETDIVASMQRLLREDFRHLCFGHGAIMNDGGSLFREALQLQANGGWNAPGTIGAETVPGRAPCHDRADTGLISMDTYINRIADDLRTAGLRAGGTVLVHSSLRSLGPVPGGAETVVQGLLRALGEGGTLLMPALSYLRVSPDQPIFDLRRTPANVGALPEYFRTRAGTLRSMHPTHSVTGIGAQAADLLAGHEADHTPCGPHSPFSRLPEVGGQVVFLGCGMRPNTSMHAIEERIEPPYLFSPEVAYTLRFADGHEVTQIYRRHGFQGWAQRYERLAALLGPDALHIGPCLQATVHIVDARSMWDAALAALRRDVWHFVEAE